MNATSPWVTAVKEIFNDQDLPLIYRHDCAGYEVKIHNIYNALWVSIACAKGIEVMLRTAYAPTDHLQVTDVQPQAGGVLIHLKASMGNFKVKVQFPDAEQSLIRITTLLKPSEPLLMPFWPRDMIITGNNGEDKMPQGEVHISQGGTRSGLQYITFDHPASGSLLYMQNLTALNDYCQATQTSLANTVGGNWPELGFCLPPAKEKPLPANKEVTIGDAFLMFDTENPNGELELAKQFMNLLAGIYLHLPRPDTQYHNWPDILDKGLYDLQNSHACWSHANGQDYLNAYVCDYETPPELMVQMAVLLPLYDYHKWSNEELVVIAKMHKGLDAFYDKKLGTVVRWLPALAEDLNESEEQLKPNVMDSWYLHHPMLNLARMALRGDDKSKKLFLDSLPFAIKVARHFKYNWPVFYNMETLEVIKEETVPGNGGEKDVAGLYADVMVHAWKLTKDEKYLEEAKKAAKTLLGKGFGIFYQANNTAFSANALIVLYKETKEKVYLDLSYLCIAGIIKNMQLWECNYGYAKDYSTFFAVFPLNDAPYTAAYEEQEVFGAMHNYLIASRGEDIMPSVSLLLSEFIRYIVQRAGYYYPPNLPKEMLSDKVKMGQVDPGLWIAIEDIHDGWEKSGEVGQEVYGAGVAFGIVPRHYYKVPDEHFLIYVDYPTADFKIQKGKSASFKTNGDARLNCRMLIVKKDKEKLPVFEVKATRNRKKESLKGILRKDGHIEFEVSGNTRVEVKW